MLHIFNVNQGQMLALDVASAVGTVHQLQEAVFSHTRVPVPDQVLLVSGGEILDAQRHVSSYHGAGTDSNPLYLVCKVSRGSATPVSCSIDIRELTMCLTGLKEDAQRLTELATSFECVQRYSDLAERFTIASQMSVQTCARLVQEQHLLHQGWQALASNLEDTVATFERRAERFKTQYDKITAIKGRAVEFLKEFDADLDLLAQIPLPSCLVKEWPTKPTFSMSPQSERAGGCTLLEWISASDPDHSLRDVADEVRTLLSQVNEAAVNAIQANLAGVREQANNREMKEIKGISKRFAQLDHHLRIAEEHEEKQRKWADLVKSQEQKALKGARDMETVREMCRIQRDTVDALIDGQQQLTTIADKFAQSKAEVLNNVRARLSGWIVETHQQLHTGSNQLALYAEKLTALKRRLDVIRQVHEAPPIYATAVSEVIRRKALREDFTTWAHTLVEKSLAIAKDEATVRENFSSKLDRHFLRSLFPGMNDKLPEFATENPRSFDQELPPLEADHLRALRRAVPALSSLLQVAEPHVYEKLLVRDPRAPITISASSGHMRREESFFSAGSPLNMTTFAKSFPSTNWLSGDENLEFSPGSDGLLMAKSPPPMGQHRSSSASSMKNSAHLGQVTPLRPLTPLGFNDISLSERMERSADSESTVVAPMSSSVAKSAPIRIPSRAPSDAMTTSRQMSEKSSHFGTPEENFGVGSSDDVLSSPPEVISRSQFTEEVGVIAKEVAALTSSSVADSQQTPETVESSASSVPATSSSDASQMELDTEKSKNSQLTGEVELLNQKLARCQQALGEHKRLFTEAARLFREELSLAKSALREAAKTTSVEIENRVSLVARSALALESQLQSDVAQAQLAAAALLHDEHQRELDALKMEIQNEKRRVYEAEKQCGHLDALIQQKDDVITLLEENAATHEKELKQKVGDAQSEVIKELTIEYELTLDAVREDNKKIMQMKEAELAELRQQINDKAALIDRLRREQDDLVLKMYDRQNADPDMVVSRQVNDLKHAHDNEIKAVRADMEMEFKSKMQLLRKGMEDRQNEALMRCQKQAEIELRMAKEKMNAQLARLEAEMAAVKAAAEVVQAAVAKEEETPRGAAEPLVADDDATIEEESDCMRESVMIDSAMPAMDDLSASMSASQSTLLDQSTSSRFATPKSTQTRIRLKDMKTMIAVQDIHESCAVLVVWDESHSAYVLFSTSSTLYFVKERSVHLMGLSVASGQPKRNWLLATVVKCEFCQIKKLDNRYKLPLGTRFYRVEVDPLPMDSSSGTSRRRGDSTATTRP